MGKINQVEKDIRDLIKVQKDNLTNGYMRGLYNGLVCALSTITGEDPKYVDSQGDNQMTEQKDIDWEKEFDEKFTEEKAYQKYMGSIIVRVLKETNYVPDDIKQFIRDKLKAVSEYYKGKIAEAIRGCKLKNTEDAMPPYRALNPNITREEVNEHLEQKAREMVEGEKE